jgi:hypothetical protein
MEIRVFGRLLFSDFALPKSQFDPAWFLPGDSAWNSLVRLEDRVSAHLFSDSGLSFKVKLASFLSTAFSFRPKLAPFKVQRITPTRSRRVTEKVKRALEKRKPHRRSILFGIPALVLLGSFVVGGLSDSANATTSCTSQQGQYGIEV